MSNDDLDSILNERNSIFEENEIAKDNFASLSNKESKNISFKKKEKNDDNEFDEFSSKQEENKKLEESLKIEIEDKINKIPQLTESTQKKEIDSIQMNNSISKNPSLKISIYDINKKQIPIDNNSINLNKNENNENIKISEKITHKELNNYLDSQKQNHNKINDTITALKQQIQTLNLEHKKNMNDINNWHNGEITKIEERNKKINNDLNYKLELIEFENNEKLKKEINEISDKYQNELDALNAKYENEINKQKLLELYSDSKQEKNNKEFVKYTNNIKTTSKKIELLSKNLIKNDYAELEINKQKNQKKKEELDILQLNIKEKKKKINEAYIKLQEREELLRQKQFDFEKLLANNRNKLKTEKKEVNDLESNIQKEFLENQQQLMSKTNNSLYQNKEKESELSNLIRINKNLENKINTLKINLEKDKKFFEEYKETEYRNIDAKRLKIQKIEEENKNKEILIKTKLKSFQEKKIYLEENKNDNEAKIKELINIEEKQKEEENDLLLKAKQLENILTQLEQEQYHINRIKEDIEQKRFTLDNEISFFRIKQNQLNDKKNELDLRMTNIDKMKQEYYSSGGFLRSNHNSFIYDNSNDDDFTNNTNNSSYNTLPLSNINSNTNRNPTFCRTLISADEKFKEIKRKLELKK